jgi:Zn-dependent M28 family amino/carboxypeptidase
MAVAYIAAQFDALGLGKLGDNKDYVYPFSFKDKSQNPHAADTDTVLKSVIGKNVIGFIDNGKLNTILVGAHYDHLGHGERGGSLSTDKVDNIHNGADDNASGVAMLIELARALKQTKDNNYNYLFVAFSGEELGLLGSNYLAKHPVIDNKNINIMINMDMVGRLQNRVLVVSGVGTSPDLKAMISEINVDSVSYKFTESGMGPSDHTSFYLQDIPVLHFFTGAHADYHKPSDDAEKVNYVGMVSVGNIIYGALQKIDDHARLAFTKTKEEKNENAPKFTVTLGVMPDYLYDGKGMRIDGVSDGKPAQVAGLQKGDVVTMLGSVAVLDMQTYMQALSKLSKGESTQVVVERGGSQQRFTIQF